MTQDEVLKMFKQSGALLEGHFRLTSGLHSDRYLQCALVLQNPQQAAALGAALAARLRALGEKPDLVIAPALGGILVAHEVARAARRARSVCGTPGRRSDSCAVDSGSNPAKKPMSWRMSSRQADRPRKPWRSLLKAGGIVMAAGSLIDRSGGRTDLGVPQSGAGRTGCTCFFSGRVPTMQDRKPGNQTRQSLDRAKRNIRLTLAFDGTAYHGWQIQNDSQTVQGLLSEAIARITGEQVTLTGSGRTDAGTHARGLVANFLHRIADRPRTAGARSEQPASQGHPRSVGAAGPSGFSCPEERRFKNLSIPDLSGSDPAATSDARIFPLPASRRPRKNGPGCPSVSGRARFRQFCEDQLSPPPAQSGASSAAN